MPKPLTFKPLYDTTLQVRLSKLKKWGYLNPDSFKSGVITWSKNGIETDSISITVSTFNEDPHIELDYKCSGELRSYKVPLVSAPSNLGKGKVWYFLCPNTYKRCRVLYFIDGYFLHREAFNGCMYESQTRSKFMRMLDSVYGDYFKADKYYEELYSKHFKTHYAGKPTKRYLKLMEKIDRSKEFTVEEIERLYMV